MKAKLKKYWIILLVVVLIALFVLYKTVSVLSDQVNWEYAENITCSDSATFEATVFRDEQVLKSDNSGERYYCFNNGEKVAKNSVVAEYYSSGDAVRINDSIESLEAEISSLEKLDIQHKYYTADLGTVTDQLKLDVYSLVGSVEKNDFITVYSVRDDLGSLYNQRSLVIGERKDYSDIISAYKSQLDELKKSQSKPTASDTAPAAGYFVNYTDGFESAADFGKITELTAMPDLSNPEKAANTVGKIVKSAKSYILFETDADTAEKLSGKSTVSVKLPTFSDTLRVTVEKINKTKSGRLVILSTMSENSLLMSTRKTDINLSFNEYSGLKINTKAIRTVKNDDGENETGVYVQVGKYIIYKKVTVLYYGGEFAVAKSGESLKVKDEVVIGGNDIDERVRN